LAIMFHFVFYSHICVCILLLIFVVSVGYSVINKSYLHTSRKIPCIFHPMTKARSNWLCCKIGFHLVVMISENNKLDVSLPIILKIKVSTLIHLKALTHIKYCPRPTEYILVPKSRTKPYHLTYCSTLLNKFYQLSLLYWVTIVKRYKKTIHLMCYI